MVRRIQMLSGAINEYEKILCGERIDFSTTFINRDTDIKTLLGIIRYAVENVLCWSPEEMAERFDNDIIKRLHLHAVTYKITFPHDLNKETDMYYYAELLYPGTCTEKRRKSAREYYVSTYLNFPNRKWSWLPPIEKGDLYLYNFLDCALEELQPDIDKNNTRALYEFFGCCKKINDFLYKANLKLLCMRQYTYPIDMLQDYLRYKGLKPDHDLYLYYRVQYFVSKNQIQLTGT